MELGVSGAPETYLLNKENEIIQKHIGIIDSNIWNKKFKNLIQ
jgi:cytochrome c biogenesis protein CcmG/thiol:disulfide interchange protein DsbE